MNQPLTTPLRGALHYLLISTLLIVTAHLLDRPALELLASPRIYETDFGRMLRVVGYLPLWGLLGVALILIDWPTERKWRRGVRLFGSAALGGIVAELLKILIRRERPGTSPEAFYSFRAWSDGLLETGGLGLPSSHALVGFAAAAILSRLFPRATVIWWLLAIGCGLSRVAAGAHFLSDVVVAAVVGYGVGWVVGRDRTSGHRPAVDDREHEVSL
jgi:membrane-associated phospholipid phosphatase